MRTLILLLLSGGPLTEAAAAPDTSILIERARQSVSALIKPWQTIPQQAKLARQPLGELSSGEEILDIAEISEAQGSLLLIVTANAVLLVEVSKDSFTLSQVRNLPSSGAHYRDPVAYLRHLGNMRFAIDTNFISSQLSLELKDGSLELTTSSQPSIAKGSRNYLESQSVIAKNWPSKYWHEDSFEHSLYFPLRKVTVHGRVTIDGTLHVHKTNCAGLCKTTTTENATLPSLGDGLVITDFTGAGLPHIVVTSDSPSNEADRIAIYEWGEKLRAVKRISFDLGIAALGPRLDAKGQRIAGAVAVERQSRSDTFKIWRIK